jgi:tRNA threonylcarbamoyladenosine biosynthesis protein TsaE
MVLPLNKFSNSENETALIAKEFSNILKKGDLVLLNGDLGTGKTFFVKSVCEGFGIRNVSSPSFAIVNEYSGSEKIIHLDFYRIRKAKELLDIGFNDYLTDDAIVFIEWAELYPEILPHKYYNIKFEYTNDLSRNIMITKHE